MRTAFVFCGGGPSFVELPPREDALVIAADAGADEARRLGIAVDLLVGDMDSVSPGTLAEIERSGARIERHPRDKDATDLELALLAARERGAGRALVVGGDGGRLDHLLGGALVLAAPRFVPMQVDAILGRAWVHVVRDRRALRGDAGETITLLAVGEPARAVRTSGLRWPLEGRDLEPGSGLGVSNELIGDEATIELASGVLLAIRPGTTEGGDAP